MSPEAWPLGDYVRALVAEVAAAEPYSALRLRRTVGDEVARIAVDDEAVLVRFAGERLMVTPAGPGDEGQADGCGTTTRATVLDLLAGRTELTDAVLSDRLRLVGPARSIVRMALAIEILIDVSTRAPALQALAARYRGESPAAVPAAPQPPLREVRRTVRAAELRLLERLGLVRSG